MHLNPDCLRPVAATFTPGLRAVLAALALAAASTSAQATWIGFEEFGPGPVNGPIVTNQYPGVLFSGEGGYVNRVTTQGGLGNFLCSASAIINCTQVTVIDWAAPISGLSLRAVGSDTVGVTAKVDVFVNGNFAATEDVTTNGLYYSSNLVDLTAYNDVTRIRIHSITDAGGLGWDDINYTAAVVPEVQTYALMLAGLGLVGWRARRRG
jgi:hypothetical protein